MCILMLSKDDIMAQILVRNIEDRVLDVLRMKAKMKGVSLESEARRILGEAALMSRQEFAARAALIRSQQRPNKTRAADLIREDRDR